MRLFEFLFIVFSISIEDDLQILRQLRALRGRISCLSDLTDTKQGLGFLWKGVNIEECLSKIKASILPLTSEAVVVQFITRVAEDLGRISHSCSDNNDATVAEAVQTNCAAFKLKRSTAMCLLRICLTGNEVLHFFALCPPTVCYGSAISSSFNTNLPCSRTSDSH